MISGAYLILSKSLSKKEYDVILKEISISLGIRNFSTTEHWSDGISNVYIKLVDSEDPSYEDSDIEKIEDILQDTAKTFISFDYDEGENALSNLLKIVKEFADRWTIAFDNCYGTLYGNSDVNRLLLEGNFFRKN